MAFCGRYQMCIRDRLHSSPEEALTGPIERGDTETVKKHLSVLTEAEKEVILHKRRCQFHRIFPRKSTVHKLSLIHI